MRSKNLHFYSSKRLFISLNQISNFLTLQDMRTLNEPGSQLAVHRANFVNIVNVTERDCMFVCLQIELKPLHCKVYNAEKIRRQDQ